MAVLQLAMSSTAESSNRNVVPLGTPSQGIELGAQNLIQMRTYHENLSRSVNSRKRFSYVLFRVTLILTFRLQICSPSCPALYFHHIRSFFYSLGAYGAYLLREMKISDTGRTGCIISNEMETNNMGTRHSVHLYIVYAAGSITDPLISSKVWWGERHPAHPPSHWSPCRHISGIKAFSQFIILPSSRPGRSDTPDSSPTDHVTLGQLHPSSRRRSN